MEELLLEETKEYNVPDEVIEEVQEEVENLLSENEVLEDGEQQDNQPNNVIFNSNVSNNNYYYQTFGISENEVPEEVVSSDIIYKPINEYTVSESLGLYSFFIGLSILLYLMIRRSIL